VQIPVTKRGKGKVEGTDAEEETGKERKGREKGEG